MLSITLQILIGITGIFAFTLLVCSGLAQQGGKGGLSRKVRWWLTITLAACVLLFPLAGQACSEDDLTDYSAHHLLVVCTPVKGGYVQNPYYTGDEKCGFIAEEDHQKRYRM